VKRLYDLFFVMLFVSYLTPLLDYPLYILGIDIVALSKVPLIALFAICCLLHLWRPLVVTRETLLFLVFGGFAIVWGLLEYGIRNKVFFSHAYAVTMPVLAVSLGYQVASDEGVEELEARLDRLMGKLFPIAVAMVVGFLYFYYVAGTWAYYGYGTPIALVGAYFLSKQSYGRWLACLVLDFLTGKRATVVASLLTAIVVAVKNPKRVRLTLATPFFAVVAVAGLIYGARLAVERDLFRRFTLLLQFDASDALAIFSATGGRLTEMFSVSEYLNEYPVRWLVGSGAGAQYVFEDWRAGFPPELMHYAHFSPMGYVFLLGLPFTLLLYASIVWRVARASPPASSAPYALFLFQFIISFFGAVMFIDPRLWVFFGMFLAMQRRGVLAVTPRRADESFRGAEILTPTPQT
jgi:hypothetical protein